MNLANDNALTELMNLFIAKCLAGAEYITPEALKLLGILAVIDLAWILCMSVLGSGEDILYTIVKRGIKYGIYTWLISNWVTGLNLTKDIFLWFDAMGAKFANVSQGFADPAAISGKGIYLALGILKSIYALGIGSIGVILLKLGLAIVIFGCFAWLSIFLFTTTLQFYIISTLTVVLLPFGVVKQLAFLSEKAIGSIFSLGVKIMALKGLLTLTAPFLASLDPVDPNDTNIGEVLTILVGAAGMVLVTLKGPEIAQDLLSGSPTFGNDAGNMASKGASMAKSAVTKPMGMAGMVQAAVQGEGGRNANGKISMSGTAKNIGRIMRHKMPDRQSEQSNRHTLWQSLNRK